jgi:HEPN domain-containing protein
MFADDPRVITVLRQWVQKAENDLTSAAQVLKLGQFSPADTVCYHAQQCVEKYLKALLINHNLDFPKTHNIAVLIALLPVQARPEISLKDQGRLTEYATTARYPGDYDPLTVSEARTAVKLARRIRGHVRKHLPKAALK